MNEMKKYRWIIFTILAGAYLLVYFHRLCVAVVAEDIMRELHTGGTIGGLLAAAYFYPYALMQLPAGLLSDSLGPRRTITIFFSIAFVGSLVLAMAPGAYTAIFGRTLVGIGVAMLFVPTMKILAEWFDAHEFARMTGLFIAMGGVGTLIATSPLAWLSSAVGWRNSFLVVGGMTLILLVLVFLVVRDRPEDLGYEPVVSRPGAGAAKIGLWEGVKMVVKNQRFWPLALWFFFTSAIFFSFGGIWGGPWLMQVYGMTKAEAGSILSMLAFGMIVGSPAHSFISDRLVKRRKPVIIMSSVMTMIIITVMTVYISEIARPLLYILCFAMGMFSNAIVVIGFTAAKELYPVSIAGTATGLINLFPFAGGAVFQPVLGHILEKQGRVGGGFTVAGFREAFTVLCICGVIAFLAGLFIKETMEKPVS